MLVLALYIDSDESRLRYVHPEAIWPLCPVLLYWISRMWQKAGRKEMHDDPMVFALKDRVSLWVGAVSVTILLAAIWA